MSKNIENKEGRMRIEGVISFIRFSSFNILQTGHSTLRDEPTSSDSKRGLANG
jgi:hypothetical protein